MKVLEALEPHPTALTNFYFENYRGDRFPKWMSAVRFSSLKHLEMKGLDRISRVVDVELPSLEFLGIFECRRLRMFPWHFRSRMIYK